MKRWQLSMFASALALAGACGDDSLQSETPDARAGSGNGGGDSWLGYRSGSRLKMRLGTTPDGASEFLGWQDTSLDVECAFTVASDGTTRCLPRVRDALTFRDSQCTRPVFFGDIGECNPVPRYVTTIEYPSSGCFGGAQRRVFETTESIYRGQLYQNGGGSCVPIQTGEALEMNEVPASAFVEQQVVVDADRG